MVRVSRFVSCLFTLYHKLGRLGRRFRDLAQGFSNWSKSRKGKRKGRRVGFPKFKSKNTTMRFAYSTGFAAPMASDPYGLKLPRIGRVHCMENVYKRVAGARLIRITVSRRAGHWYASLTVEREPAAPASVSSPKRGAVGVDLGVKTSLPCRMARLSLTLAPWVQG